MCITASLWQHSSGKSGSTRQAKAGSSVASHLHLALLRHVERGGQELSAARSPKRPMRRRNRIATALWMGSRPNSSTEQLRRFIIVPSVVFEALSFANFLQTSRHPRLVCRPPSFSAVALCSLPFLDRPLIEKDIHDAYRRSHCRCLRQHPRRPIRHRSLVFRHSPR